MAPGSPFLESQEVDQHSALAVRRETRAAPGLGSGNHQPTLRALTSAAVRAQEAQEAVAGPRDTVAVAIAIAGTVIH